MNFRKIGFMAVAVFAALLCSCNDEPYECGMPVSGSQYHAVSFGEDNVRKVELDPAEPTTLHVSVFRDSKSADETITVPVHVLTNTGGVFDVPSHVTFLKGDSVSDIVVDFPRAEAGKYYSLEIALDDSYVHPYKTSTTNTYGYSVCRVKWNDIGNCKFYDSFMAELGFRNGYYVRIQQKDGEQVYRLLDPYGGMNNDADSEMAGLLPKRTDMITFSILNTTDEDRTGKVFNYVSFDSWVTGYEYEGTDMIYAYVPSEVGDEYAADDAYSLYYSDDGCVMLYPFYYIPSMDGGFGDEYPVIISFPSDDTKGSVAGTPVLEK